jgi:hypothetical protein
MNTDISGFAILMLAIGALFGPFLWVALYLFCYAIPLWLTPTANTQSNELQLGTCVGCPKGICCLPLFVTNYHTCIFAELGHFSTIIAFTSIAKSYRRKIKGKSMLIEDGIAHFEQDKNEKLVWEVVEEYSNCIVNMVV